VSDDWLLGDARQDRATQAILAAARQVLQDRGLERFTAEAVAAAAGCSRATLYRHVGGKRALLDALLTASGAEIAREVLARVGDRTGPERVVAGFTAALERVRSDPPITTFLRRSVATDVELGRAADLTALASRITGVEDPAALTLVYRTFLSLVLWPLADTDHERAVIERLAAGLPVGAQPPDRRSET